MIDIEQEFGNPFDGLETAHVKALHAVDGSELGIEFTAEDGKSVRVRLTSEGVDLLIVLLGREREVLSDLRQKVAAATKN